MKTPIQDMWNKVIFWKGEGTINLGYKGDDTENKPTPNKQTNGDAVVGIPQEELSGAPKREQWSSPVEFLLSCVAMSVGLGNVWRFPFTAYENGGGAFIIPYILVLLFIGKPLYYMELCLGQFASYGSVKVWNISPAFRGVGYGQMIATWAVVTYYVSLMALTVYYFFASFTSELPWSECGDWASDSCVGSSDTHVANSTQNVTSASEDYFMRVVLRDNGLGLDNGIDSPIWHLSLCLLFSWLVLFLVLVKGVQGSGKAAYFTALFPYLVLFVLLIRGATLEGAVDGIVFFLKPQWEKLLEGKVWYAAVSQSFFSLSVGFGSIIMFSSYNDFRHNVFRDATIISITDTLTSLLAGVTIFSILGHLASQLGVDVKDVLKNGGTSLAFISYPDVLARFTFAPQFFAVMFFLMLFTLGVGSASALTGCVITIICDDFPNLKKPIVTGCVCLVGLLMGLFYVTPQGQYILTLVDHYGGGFIIFILAFLEVIAVNWVYGIENFCRDIEFMLGRKTGMYWKFCWAFLVPILLLVIFIYVLYQGKSLKHGTYVFGTGALAFGQVLTALAVIMVPIFFGYVLMKNSKKTSTFIEALIKSFKPTSDWSPKDPIIRKQYYEFIGGDRTEAVVKTEVKGIDNPAMDDKIYPTITVNSDSNQERY